MRISRTGHSTKSNWAISRPHNAHLRVAMSARGVSPSATSPLWPRLPACRARPGSSPRSSPRWRGLSLPGPGSSVRSITVEVKLRCRSSRSDGKDRGARKRRTRQLSLDGQCTGPTGQPVANATLEVVAPTTRIRRDVPEHRLDELLEPAAISSRCYRRVHP